MIPDVLSVIRIRRTRNGFFVGNHKLLLSYYIANQLGRIRYLISHHHMPQKIRQIKNNLRRKIHDNLHKDSKRNTFEADQYFNPPVILIGNKSDGDESRRQVDQKTAEAKAQELGNFMVQYDGI